MRGGAQVGIWMGVPHASTRHERALGSGTGCLLGALMAGETRQLRGRNVRTDGTGTVLGMGFDVSVGLFLCDDAQHQAYWPVDERERYLDNVNGALRRLGLAEHREPRSLAEIDPPLDPQIDPCLLGASMGSYSSHGRRSDRLDWLARHVAMVGEAPSTDPPYEPEMYDAYEAPPDRRLMFDHLLATCGHEVIVLPRRLERVMWAPSAEGAMRFVSAHRLQAEAVALGFVLRRPDPAVSDSPTVDWLTGAPVEDQSFATLDARIADDSDTGQRWAEESDLCHRLLTVAADVLHTGALAIAG